jgi:tetratricopeptide (TPR) repeat protein
VGRFIDWILSWGVKMDNDNETQEERIDGAGQEGSDVSDEMPKENGSGFVGKLIVGIGAVVAAAFAGKALAQKKKHKNYSFEGQERINPVLEEIRDKRGMEMFMARKEEGSISVHIVSPNPSDYFGGWKDASESDEKKLFFRGIEKKEEYHYGEALDIFTNLLSRGALGVDNVAILIMAGNTYYSQSMFSEAEKFYQKALGEASGIKDEEGEAIATGNLCITYLHKNMYDKARRNGEDALKKYRQLGVKEHEADTLSNLALVYRRNGEADKAMRIQEEALKIHKHLEDTFHMAEDLGNLGLIHQQKNETDKALEYFNESLKLHKDLKNKKGEAEQLGNIGGAYQMKGDYSSALECEEESLQIHRALGNMDGEANQLGNIGLIYQQKGENDKAIAYFGDALRLHKQTGNRMGEATGMVNIGILYRKTGELEKAMEYQRGALKIFTSLGARKQTEICQANIAKIQDMMVIRRVE